MILSGLTTQFSVDSEHRCDSAAPSSESLSVLFAVEATY